MMSSADFRPPLPPPRSASSTLPSRVTFQGPQTWRESIAAFMAGLLCIVILVSFLILGFYVWRDRQVYEELVDYLDKTISISKINFNHFLGLYTLSEKELNALGDQRTYKWILWSYALADLGCFLFPVLLLLLYYSSDVSSGTRHVVFWILVIIGALYCICEVHLFTFMLFPYSAQLPNTTELLLNHAIPHNPGGLQQMEQRLGCTFDHNLYAANKRRLNPRNTCDPQIESSYISHFVLITLLCIRLIPFVVSALLLAKRTPFSESIAQFVENMRPAQKKQRLYIKKQHSRPGKDKSDLTKKNTTFGVAEVRDQPATPLPMVPSPTQVDHSISYNNAAYFATSGALGLNSSRSSEISRIDANDLFRPLSHHASGSIQSEV